MTFGYVANENIVFEKFVLIDDQGNNLGEKTYDEATSIAYEKKLDLVLVNSNEENPVCKIMDLGKKMYDEKMKAKGNKSSHKKQKVKEIRFSVLTDPHDLEIKARSINKFLSNGSKVKISIRFPSRQKDQINSTIKVAMSKLLGFVNNDLEYEVGSDSYSNNNYLTELIPKK